MFARWLRPRVRALGTYAAVLGWGLVCVGIAIAIARGFTTFVDGADFVFGILGFAAGAALFSWGWRTVRAKKLARAERIDDALHAWMAKHEWHRSNSDRVLAARGFPFSLAGQHSVVQMVRGPYRGREAMFMRYRVQGASDSAKSVYDFVVVAIAADADFEPTVALPQRGWNEVASLVGLPDIDVESKAFNDRWRLVGRDRSASHAIMQPRVIDRLLDGDAGSYAVTWDASTILVANEADALDIAVLAPQLRLISDLAELVPGYMSRGVANPRALQLVHPPATFITRRESFFTVMAPCIVFVAGGFLAALLPDDAATTLAFDVLFVVAALWLGGGFAWTGLANRRRRRAWLESLRGDAQPVRR